MMPRAVSFTYTPRHLSTLGKMLRELGKELRIVGIGWERVGFYIVWWRPAPPRPADAHAEGD